MMRDRSLRPGLEGLLLLTAYSALTVWWLWPLPAVWSIEAPYFGADFGASVADFYLIVWALSWDTHALFTAPLRLFDANIFYPSPLSLAYSEHFLGYVPIFALPYALSGNPILAVNVLIFATYPLCALAMYFLARRFMSRPAAATAGFFYAFCLWRYRSVPHLHMLGVQYLPLVLLFTERWLEARRPRDAVALALAMILQALSSYYLAYALGLMYAPYLLAALWRWRRRVDARRLAGLAAVGAALGAVVVCTSLPYLKLRALGLIPEYGESGTQSLGLMPAFGGRKVWEYFSTDAVGPVGYLLALVALLPPWRGGRWPRAIAVLLVVVGTLLALGPGLRVGAQLYRLPYDFLLDVVPGLSSVRLPLRFRVVVQLGLALLAGLGLARLTARTSGWLAWSSAFAAAGAALWSFSLPVLPLHPELTGEAVPAPYRWLAEHRDGRALLEVPGGDFPVMARRMYFSTYHWLPTIGGYSGYPPASAEYLHRVARGLPAREALQEIVDLVDVGWILVHLDELSPSAVRRWHDPEPGDGLELIGVWHRDALLRVTLPVAEDRRGRLASARETLGGVPLAPLGAQCPGDLQVVMLPPEPWLVRTPGRVVLELANRGDAPWPGMAFSPRHLVRVSARFVSAKGRELPAQQTALPGDVPAGGTLQAPLIFIAPAWPGSYRLELSLVQTEDGPLARCGVAPIEVPVRIVRHADAADHSRVRGMRRVAIAVD
ncbi:MAG TPA: hypothetical protein VEI94_16395 [Candidatus Bathyarchaeia archaeon]|nr:hypothetical protein [Candidatus Bathyarchaeia archaeon]